MSSIKANQLGDAKLIATGIEKVDKRTKTKRFASKVPLIIEIVLCFTGFHRVPHFSFTSVSQGPFASHLFMFVTG